MAIVTEEILNACVDGAVVSATYDDQTGVVEKLEWVVQTGVLILPAPKVVARRRRLVLGARDDDDEELARSVGVLRARRHRLPLGGQPAPRRRPLARGRP
jgi:hypothetical protein